MKVTIVVDLYAATTTLNDVVNAINEVIGVTVINWKAGDSIEDIRKVRVLSSILKEKLDSI